jgi:hypothetical protein
MLSDNVSIIPSLSQALEIVRAAVDSPLPAERVSWDGFIEHISIPLRVADLVSDRSKAAVGRWLVWGLGNYRGGASVASFCKEVRDGLIEMGIENVPSQDTLRAWYYAATHTGLSEMIEEDGFGMASACLLSEDPDGERAQALRGAAKQVASETGMGQVTAARQLKQAYQGHGEKEWADGLPRLVYIEGVDTSDVGERKLFHVAAQWRDKELTYLGWVSDPDGFEHGTRDRVASQHLVNSLHLRKWEEEQ